MALPSNMVWLKMTSSAKSASSEVSAQNLVLVRSRVLVKAAASKTAGPSKLVPVRSAGPVSSARAKSAGPLMVQSVRVRAPVTVRSVKAAPPSKVQPVKVRSPGAVSRVKVLPGAKRVPVKAVSGPSLAPVRSSVTGVSAGRLLVSARVAWCVRAALVAGFLRMSVRARAVSSRWAGSVAVRSRSPRAVMSGSAGPVRAAGFFFLAAGFFLAGRVAGAGLGGLLGSSPTSRARRTGL